jgi:hemolysin activation/secretion protein
MSIKQLHSIVTQASLFYLSWCSAAIAQSDSPLPSPPQLRETHVNAEEITFPLQLPDEPAEKIVQSESSQPIARENRLREKIKPPTKIAQNLPPPGTLEPPTTPPPLPETPQPPSTPFFPTPPQTPPTPSPSPSDFTFRIRQIKVLGSTIFSQEQLQSVTNNFIDREVTYDDLLEIRTAITRLYVENGYTTSGAFLPPQDLTTGVVQIQVVEGKLEQVNIQGLERLREVYVRSRIEVAAREPLNIPRLEEALQLLQLNPIIERVQAELSAGTAPGLSVLNLEIKEASALTLGVLGENTDSPSVGENSVTVYAAHNNFAGLGDRISADVRDTRGLTQYSLGYEIPINPYDGTLSFRYSNSRSKILEQPFAVLNIRSESDTLSFGFNQPIIRTPKTEFTLGASLDLRQSQTFILGDRPFSFSLGPEEGKSKVSVLRLSQEWVNRSESRVLAARSQLNVGLNWLNATINNTGVDGDFMSWNGQFQWVEAFSQDTVLVARIGTQIAFDSLLPLEQFSIGGTDTVRGYRRNQRVGDSGFISSVEMRFTILRDPGRFGTVQFVPFVDYGMVWNYDDELVPNPDPRVIASVGLSLRWQWNPMFSARLDWGVPLIPIPNPGNALQDRGLVFSIRFQPF